MMSKDASARRVWDRMAKALLKRPAPLVREDRIAPWRFAVTVLAFIGAVLVHEGAGRDEATMGAVLRLTIIALAGAAGWVALLILLKLDKAWAEATWGLVDTVMLAVAAGIVGVAAPVVLVIATVRIALLGVQFNGAAWVSAWATLLLAGGVVSPETPMSLEDGLAVGIAALASAAAWVIGKLILDESVDREQARNQQRELLGMVSHELRSPLHVIASALQVIDREALAAKDRRLLASIDESAKTLQELVTETLAISAIRQGAVRLAPTEFRLHHLVARVAEAMTPLAAKGAVRLTWSIDESVPVLRGSKRHIEQVLTNLGTNAIKYTRPGGSVRVSIHHYFEKPTTSGKVTLVFSFADTGIGIPNEIKASLFEPFTQGSVGAARRYDGVGLGLYIVRSLSDAMGGHLEVADNAGGGTVFTWQVALDVVGDDALTERRTGARRGEMKEMIAEHRAQTRPLRCLIIDDHPASRMVLNMFLAQAGHRVRECVSGDDGIEAIRAGGIDIVFLDLHMPGVSGWDVLAAITEKPGTAAAPPIVMLSGAWDGDTSELARARGAADYLSKPVEFGPVLRILRRRASALDGDVADAVGTAGPRDS